MCVRRPNHRSSTLQTRPDYTSICLCRAVKYRISLISAVASQRVISRERKRRGKEIRSGCCNGQRHAVKIRCSTSSVRLLQPEKSYTLPRTRQSRAINSSNVSCNGDCKDIMFDAKRRRRGPSGFSRTGFSSSCNFPQISIRINKHTCRRIKRIRRKS